MSDTRQAPSGDASFRSSLTRLLAGAAAVVVLGAVSFWAVGSIGGGDETLVVADEPDPGPAEPAEPADDAAEEEPETADDAEEDAPDEGAAEGSDDPADDPAGDDGDDPDGDDAADDGGDAADDDDADEDGVARDVDPSSVTIQILDGYKTDGGTAADTVAGQLEGEGYSVVARNDGLSNATTTVLYNPGHEDAARQVAAELGGVDVSPQSGSLSTSVALHVVVGADRG